MLGAIVIVQGAAPPDPAQLQASTAALEAVCDRVVVLGSEVAAAATHPLAGDPTALRAVTEALGEADRGHVAVLAADIIHPSAELLRYMAHVTAGFEAVVPDRRDGTPQPLAAVYHTSLLRRADGLLAAGQRDLTGLLDLANVRHISVEEVAKFGEPERLLERAGPTPP